MAVTNNIQIQASCESLIITDTSDWDTVDPVAEIDTIDITVEIGGVEYDLAQIAGYSTTTLATITPSDLGLTGDTYSDGIYRITVVFTDTAGPTTYTVNAYLPQTCNADCSLNQLVLQVADDTCDDCRRDSAIEVYELIVSLHAICAAVACGNISRAELLLNCVTDALANFDCKNC